MHFAITGVAGYVAPRHLKAIKDTGNDVVAAHDPHDSVGILDSFFPQAGFFTEFERFDRHLEKIRRASEQERVQFLSICSPNNLHDAHIRLALRIGADAICEKPLVLNPWNLDALQKLEAETGSRVYTILQLRVHPALVSLRDSLMAKSGSKRHTVRLTYITGRGQWYRYSWKGSVDRSGGLATNIGVHLFDLLIWLFGGVNKSVLQLSESDRMGGFLELKNADVEWFLSIRPEDIIPLHQESSAKTYRSITIDGAEIPFSEGFTDLHTVVYRRILEKDGFGIEDARPSIELVASLRKASVTLDDSPKHSLVLRPTNGDC